MLAGRKFQVPAEYYNVVWVPVVCDSPRSEIGFVPQKFLAGISSDIKDSRHND